MTYPLKPGKYRHRSVTRPSTPFERDASFPESVILCFQPPVYEYARDTHRGQQRDSNHPRYSLYQLEDPLPDIGVVGNLGIGGPATVRVVEELIARGVDAFVIVGHAGGLQREIDLGDVVVVERALRDEGTSYHYLEPDRAVAASSTMREALVAAAEANGETVHVGTTWTTDAIFRQTPREVESHANDGVLTVDMEAASAFAVASYREVEAGAAFIISDYVGPEDWGGQLAETWPHLERLFDVTLDSLANKGPESDP